MDIQIEVFKIIVLVFSAIIHEFMHGWAADQLGDPTAKLSGRLTLNPIPHIDPVGSIILPALLILTNSGFIFGWAKPVPVNTMLLKDGKFGEAKVALAGPLANLVTALFFGLILRFFYVKLVLINPIIISLLLWVVLINIVLMVFNLVPIPPLDGSKVIFPFLSYELQEKYIQIERYGMILLLVFIMFGFKLIIPIIYFFVKIITGIDLNMV